MLFCTVPYYIVWHCIVLHSIVLQGIVLYRIIFYWITLHCIVLYLIVFYCSVSYCMALYCIVWYRVTSHRIISIPCHTKVSYLSDFWKLTTWSLSNQTSPNSVNLLLVMWSFFWWVHFFNSISFTHSVPVLFSNSEVADRIASLQTPTLKLFNNCLCEAFASTSNTTQRFLSCLN